MIWSCLDLFCCSWNIFGHIELSCCPVWAGWPTLSSKRAALVANDDIIIMIYLQFYSNIDFKVTERMLLYQDLKMCCILVDTIFHHFTVSVVKYSARLGFARNLDICQQNRNTVFVRNFLLIIMYHVMISVSWVIVTRTVEKRSPRFDVGWNLSHALKIHYIMTFILKKPKDR